MPINDRKQLGKEKQVNKLIHKYSYNNSLAFTFAPCDLIN